MPFGNISAFYIPIVANAGSSLWGTDVRLLKDTADATNNNTTVMSMGTGAGGTRTADPYSTTSSDLDQSLYGWAIQPSDMNSVSGAKRFFPAGNHVATLRINNTATAVTGTLSMFVYRVGPSPTRTRTLLGSGSNSVNLANAGDVTATVTVALSEVIFDADETVQYSFEWNSAGAAIIGRNVRIFDGTASGVAARVNTPTLGVLADTTGSAAGAGTATGSSALLLGTVGTSTGAGSVSGVASSTGAGTGSAAGVAAAAGVGASRADTTGTAAGAASVAGAASKVLGTVGTAEVGAGGGTVVRRPIFLFDD